MIQRHLERKLRTAAEQYPVVLLTGPRQSGKTTLVRAVFPDHPRNCTSLTPACSAISCASPVPTN